MDKQGGLSFFLPHGLVRKDKKLDNNRESLAHHYFCYSESEKIAWVDNYDIDEEKFAKINFIEKECVSAREYPQNISGLKVLILLDNYQVSLVSKINTFRSFRELHDLLNRLGFTNICVRPHPSFFTYCAKKVEDRDIVDKYFLGSMIENPFEKPLLETIGDYDIVIGPLTTCIYEAMIERVLFIPYIPDFFPGRTTDEIIDAQWLPGLYPAPCTNLKEVKNVLSDYISSPSDFYENFVASLKRIGISEESDRALWEAIIDKCRKAENIISTDD